MRSLPIVHVQSFAQSRLALRAISDNYEHVGKYTDVRVKEEKPDEKWCRIFWGVGPSGCGYGSGLLRHTDTDHDQIRIVYGND